MKKQDIEKYLGMVGLELQKQKEALALVEKYVPEEAIPEDVRDEIEERFEP